MGSSIKPRRVLGGATSWSAATFPTAATGRVEEQVLAFGAVLLQGCDAFAEGRGQHQELFEWSGYSEHDEQREHKLFHEFTTVPLAYKQPWRPCLLRVRLNAPPTEHNSAEFLPFPVAEAFTLLEFLFASCNTELVYQLQLWQLSSRRAPCRPIEGQMYAVAFEAAVSWWWKGWRVEAQKVRKRKLQGGQHAAAEAPHTLDDTPAIPEADWEASLEEDLAAGLSDSEEHCLREMCGDGDYDDQSAENKSDQESEFDVYLGSASAMAIPTTPALGDIQHDSFKSVPFTFLSIGARCYHAST